MTKRNLTLWIGCIISTLALTACSLPANAQFAGMQPRKHFPWSNARLSPDVRADMVIKKMTLDQKIQLLHGLGWMSRFRPTESVLAEQALKKGNLIPGIPSLGLPNLQMTDSVVGISNMGPTGRYATALPSAEAQAASWNTALAREIGTMEGHQLRALGFNMSLGSGIDLIRDPLDGRTFEYLGEDPLLAGTMAGHLLKAEEATHVITDLKHYAINNQEEGRNTLNAIIGKRAMRENDLLAFHIAIDIAHPGAVMCAYNKVNGTYSCENKYLLTDVLRNAFHFKGFVVSDWGATQSTVRAAMAGLDVEMPGNHLFGPALKKAVEDGRVPMSRLNEMVHRVLRSEFAAGIVDDPPHPHSPNVMRGFEVAQQVEEQGAVLLKNANHQLPLNAGAMRSIAVIGGHANVGVMSGGGSSQVSPAGGNAVPPPAGQGPGSFFRRIVYQRSPPLKGIRAHATHAVVQFNSGTDPAAAAALAKSSQVAIVFAVQHESEGEDLPNLSLPGNQNALIEAVAAANPHTIVVLETGGPVLMPWIHKVSAVLEAWYPGIRGSQAIANILFGNVNPSGRLPISFPLHESDLPPNHVTPPAPDAQHPIPPLKGFPPSLVKRIAKPTVNVHYVGGLKVGYKWYQAEHKPMLYPFGFGLSYTTFAFSKIHVKPGTFTTVTFTVTNTGSRPGVETPQVYASLPASAGEPPNRLVGWAKVSLAPGQSKRVSIRVDRDRLTIYRVASNSWKLVPGKYVIRVGSSSSHLPLRQTISF